MASATQLLTGSAPSQADINRQLAQKSSQLGRSLSSSEIAQIAGSDYLQTQASYGFQPTQTQAQNLLLAQRFAASNVAPGQPGMTADVSQALQNIYAAQSLQKQQQQQAKITQMQLAASTLSPTQLASLSAIPSYPPASSYYFPSGTKQDITPKFQSDYYLNPTLSMEQVGTYQTGTPDYKTIPVTRLYYYNPQGISLGGGAYETTKVPATKEQEAYFNQYAQTNFLTTPAKQNILTQTEAAISNAYTFINNRLRDYVDPPINALYSAINFNPNFPDLDRTTKFLESRKVSPVLIDVSKVLSFEAGAGFGILESFRKEPALNVALIGAGFAFGGLTKGAELAFPSIAPEIAGGAYGFGAGLGAKYILSSVAPAIIAAKTPGEKGMVFGKALLGTTEGILGYELGEKSATTLYDIWRTRSLEKIEPEQIILKQVLEGEKYPTFQHYYPDIDISNLNQAERQFLDLLVFQSQEFSYHASPQEFYGGEILPGSSEVAGLYSAPSVSIHFTDITPSSPQYTIFPTAGEMEASPLRPTISKIFSDFDVTKLIGTGKEELPGTYAFIETEPGVSYPVGLKPEIESVIPTSEPDVSHTELTQLPTQFYTEFGGRRIPIREFSADIIPGAAPTTSPFSNLGVYYDTADAAILSSAGGKSIPGAQSDAAILGSSSGGELFNYPTRLFSKIAVSPILSRLGSPSKSSMLSMVYSPGSTSGSSAPPSAPPTSPTYRGGSSGRSAASLNSFAEPTSSQLTSSLPSYFPSETPIAFEPQWLKDFGKRKKVFGKALPTYSVFIRRAPKRGAKPRYIPFMSDIPTRGRAIRIGEERALNTLARSFLVRKTGTREDMGLFDTEQFFPEEKLKFFRTYKIRGKKKIALSPDEYIQRTGRAGAALMSAGEKAEIAYFKSLYSPPKSPGKRKGKKRSGGLF